jgi:para-aminobenzoate synthetase
MNTPEYIILQEVQRLRTKLYRPVVVALDGGSGAGKTTIAERLRRLSEIVIVPLDDFYQTVIPESQWPYKSVAERLQAVFDWSRVRREALEPLRAGRPGRWHAFDFASGLGERGTYCLKPAATEVRPASTVLIDGAYSASPWLRDLVDLTVLVNVETETRHFRTAMRERDDSEFLAKWHSVWDDVEQYYFRAICPPESFDLVVENGRDSSRPDAACPI